jgi:hypothetical protein
MVSRVLYGPVGSGKSTDLLQTAWESKSQGRGVAFIRAHEPNTRETGSDSEVVTAICRMILKQIGCSQGPSLVERFFLGGFPLTKEARNRAAEIEEEVITQYLCWALDNLYQVAEELTRKTGKETRILTDDLNDLRRTANGRRVLSSFLCFAVMSGADIRKVSTVFVNSDCDPIWSFHQGTRVIQIYQVDPPESGIREMLVGAKKYSVEAVDKILGVCGTRLGLLSPFLKATEDQVRSADWVEETLQSHIKDAVAGLEALGKREATREDKEAMRWILDNMVADIRYRKGEWFPEGGIPRDALPRVYKEPFPTDVLLRGPGRSVLFFQSAAVRHAWHHACDKNAWGVAPSRADTPPLK